MTDQDCDQCDEFNKMWEGAKILSGSNDPGVIQKVFDTTSGTDLIAIFNKGKERAGKD